MNTDKLQQAKALLESIRRLPLEKPIKVMNVCGGHERVISMSGIRTALPGNIELIPGPGCPVCICPEEDIHDAIQMGLQHNAIIAAYGDMLRVPINTRKSEIRSLEQARGAGADVRPIASPVEAVEIAMQNPDKAVIFFAAGFETTTAPTAAMLEQGTPDNLYVLLSGRRTWPAVRMLLESDKPGFDALIAPGHVSAIMGSNEWQFVCDEFAIPAAVSGFQPEQLLMALTDVVQQVRNTESRLNNCYSEVVHEDGNKRAQASIEKTMDIVDARWRGIGVIPASGYQLNEQYQHKDARAKFPVNEISRKRAGEMPAGCDCASVVLGKIYPDQCRIYGKACTPRSPVGPCMVSDEGACRIWWSAGRRNTDKDTKNAAEC